MSLHIFLRNYARRTDMAKLAGLRSNADLFTGAIIIWVENNVCPAGYSRVDTYDNKYLVAGDSVETLGELVHQHIGDSHYHVPTATTTGLQTTTKGISGGAAQTVEQLGSHTFSAVQSGGTGAAIDNANSPGLAKVDVLICRKD